MEFRDNRWGAKTFRARFASQRLWYMNYTWYCYVLFSFLSGRFCAANTFNSNNRFLLLFFFFLTFSKLLCGFNLGSAAHTSWVRGHRGQLVDCTYICVFHLLRGFGKKPVESEAIFWSWLSKATLRSLESGTCTFFICGYFCLGSATQGGLYLC